MWPTEPDDAAWMARARRLDAFQCDVAFRVADSIYVGPASGAGSREWHEANWRLPPPDLRLRDGGKVLTADLLGREDELVAHYERLIRVAGARCKAAALRQPFPYFSVTPTIMADGQMLATSP